MKQSKPILQAVLGLGCVVTALALTGAPTAAQTAPASSPTLTNATFDQLPSGAAFERFYPREARIQSLSGRVAMRCGVNETGALINCVSIALSSAKTRRAGAAARRRCA